MHCMRFMTFAEYREHPMVKAFDYTQGQPPVCSWCCQNIEGEPFVMMWTTPPDDIHCQLSGMPQVECIHNGRCRDEMGAAMRQRWANAGEAARLRGLLRECRDVWHVLAASHGCATEEDAVKCGDLFNRVCDTLGED